MITINEKRTYVGLQQLILSPRQGCDLDMLLTDAFSPVSGFLSQADYESVLMDLRLSTNQLCPIPITLDVSDEFAKKISVGDDILLCDVDQTLLARMHITDKWRPNKRIEAEHVFGTHDCKHPAVNYLFNTAGEWYLGGSVQRLASAHTPYEFEGLCHTPKALKQLFVLLGWEKIIGFQTRNPIHRAHMELMLNAAEQVGGQILLHPVVGLTKSGDIDCLTRVRCYQKILPYYPNGRVLLSLLPLAMRMAGPREAVWHALIRKNYGCTHFIVGRDHAGPGNDSCGKPFYDPYEAQRLTVQYEDEIGIKIIPFQEMVYVKERRSYVPVDAIKPDETPLSISGTQLRESILKEEPIPDWFSFPEIIQELRDSYSPRHKQGFTLFFTGLSGSGKSTIARALVAKLKNHDPRKMTIIDGDRIRQILGDKIGFSQADRNLNIRLISYVASEITQVGGIAICAAIAPYQSARAESRQLISQHGGYIEIHISTSLTVCTIRDTKGLYAKFNAGKLKNLTGVDDPYEAPDCPDMSINTELLSIEESVEKIIGFLYSNGYLKQHESQFIEQS